MRLCQQRLSRGATRLLVQLRCTRDRNVAPTDGKPFSGIKSKALKDPLLLDIPRELIGPRILLRAYTPADAQHIHDAVVESRADLTPFFEWAANDRTIESRQAGLQRGAAGFLLRNEFGYGIWHLENGKYLGDIGIYAPDWKVRKFEIGYWLRSSAVGFGYATEGARLLIDMAFNLFEARRVCIQCDADNEKSAGVPKRLGFEQEGHLRNNMVKPNGEPCDTLVFGMTPHRWKTNCQS